MQRKRLSEKDTSFLNSRSQHSSYTNLVLRLEQDWCKRTVGSWAEFFKSSFVSNTTLRFWNEIPFSERSFLCNSGLLIPVEPALQIRVKTSPGSTFLCELTRHFYPVLSPSCGTEDSQSGERFQVDLDRGFPRLQPAFSSSAPRARRCGMEMVLDQLTFGTFCS